jgi:hypothetical protein
MLDRLAHDLVARSEVAAIHFLDEESRERRHQLRDRAARGVDLDRNRDRVAVVLDEVDDGQ